MKRYKFFSMIREGGKVTVKEQNGYTDGEFNYYSPCRGTWFCVDPQSGLAVATGSTKEKAQQAAKNVTDRFEKARSTEWYKKQEKLFAELRSDARIQYI